MPIQAGSLGAGRLRRGQFPGGDAIVGASATYLGTTSTVRVSL